MTFFESSSRSNVFLEHDLFRKPVSTFRDHALARRNAGSCRRYLRCRFASGTPAAIVPTKLTSDKRIALFSIAALLLHF